MATKRSVHTWADAVIDPSRAHEHHRLDERILAAQHVKTVGRVAQHLERVAVERAHCLFDAADVRGASQLEDGRGGESTTGAIRDVVDDDRHGTLGRDGADVLNDAHGRRPHVIRDHHEHARDRGKPGERGSGAALWCVCCWCRCRP